MRWLLVLLALVLPATVSAAPPDGFRESWRLTPRAAVIAGVPDAKVYCARTAIDWSEFVASQGHSGRIEGLTDSAQKLTYLPPASCRTLENHLRGRKVGWFALGFAAQTLVHEAMHLRGIRDEFQAECQALREVPKWLRTRFGITRAQPLRLAMRGVRYSHRLALALNGGRC